MAAAHVGAADARDLYTRLSAEPVGAWPALIAECPTLTGRLAWIAMRFLDTASQ